MNSESKQNEELTALIVDNEQKICDLIKLFLNSSKKFKVIVTANNAVQAMQKLQNQTFDVVITDHAMNGKSGIELIGTLYRTPKFRNMKYILISGRLTQENVMMALEEGGKHILVKPFSRLQLLGKVSEVLGVKLSN